MWTGTYDGSTQYLYLDVSQVGSLSWSGSILSTNDTVSIGASYNLGSWKRYWDGMIHLVMVFNRGLPESEIKAVYEKTKPLYVG